jgi:hypothetical protein
MRAADIHFPGVRTAKLKNNSALPAINRHVDVCNVLVRSAHNSGLPALGLRLGLMVRLGIGGSRQRTLRTTDTRRAAWPLTLLPPSVNRSITALLTASRLGVLVEKSLRNARLDLRFGLSDLA